MRFPLNEKKKKKRKKSPVKEEKVNGNVHIPKHTHVRINKRQPVNTYPQPSPIKLAHAMPRQTPPHIAAFITAVTIFCSETQHNIYQIIPVNNWDKSL